MSFVTPLLLAGTAFIAVPIILHLVMRRKPMHVEFPALRLVRSRHETNRRRMNLRHLLLLLLRAGAIALIAVALSRPSLKFSGSLGSQESPVAAALVFDCAPRMEYRRNNQTRLEASKEMGLWLLTQLPPESQVAVLDTKPGPSVFQIDRGAARERIERLAAVPNSLPLAQVTAQALSLVGESDLGRKEVYVFTDLAAAAWPESDAATIAAAAAKAADAGVYLVDVGVQNPVNYSLGEPRLSAQVISANSPLGAGVELTLVEPDAGRAEGGRSRGVEIFLLDAEGNPQRAGQREVELGEAAGRQLEFTLGPLAPGVRQGFLRIVGQDALAADDTRYFSVAVKEPWRILIVAPGTEHTYASFLEELIAPESWRLSGQARFRCDMIEQNSLADAKLDDYAAVCLLDPKPLDERQWRRLADYAAAGGGTAVFLGRNAQPVDSFNRPAAQEILAGPLVRQARAPDEGVVVAPQNLQHPVLSEFKEITGSIPWQDTPVLRYWELAGLAKGAAAIVNYSDGRPALIERSVGAGLAVTMTTPISDSAGKQPWNLLPVADQWPFLILTNRLMLYLVGSTGERLNYLAGQTAVVPLDPKSPFRSYLVAAPDEITFSVSADPKENYLAVSATDQAGNYRVRAGGRASGFDGGFSVNLAARQTELGRADKEYLDKLFGPLKYRIAENRNQIERDVSIGRVGRELFPLLIFLAALMLGGELLLANRFYREVKVEGR